MNKFLKLTHISLYEAIHAAIAFAAESLRVEVVLSYFGTSMNFVADESVDQPIVTYLRKEGYTVLAIMGFYGTSHHCNEDIGTLRAIANLILMAPCDGNAIRAALTSLIDIYFRVGRGREAVVYTEPPSWRVGGSHSLREGKDVTIFAIGNFDRLVKIGIPDEYNILGPPTHLYRHYGLDGAAGVAA